MDRYICIHGHFYQPPRENPWLEFVELQLSARPYHDWNERVTAECYAPNATSRILDGENRIVEIVNNYSQISFDFGPTLLSWLEANSPDVYHAILRADREGRQAFSGHGSAIAQAYNHMIMPLANERDKYTQVVWGIADFVHRFGRKPEGMWLPETAVDTETLEIMAGLGIKFTILAQHQAKRVRKIGSRTWEEVQDGRIDPTRAYRVRLPSRRRFSVFLYDGPISRAVAFEGLLANGENFASRLTSALSAGRTWPELVHIATDGETYGHHHRFGEMALSYALRHLQNNSGPEITVYGEYLSKHPPTHEIEINENTSWSCIHGVERWRNDCGCNTGAHAGWNQAWRAPLRHAMDWLRDTLTPQYEYMASQYLKDPWAARNDYIDVILDRSDDKFRDFLSRHANRDLHENDRVRVTKLLELQRHAMLMYTSCGWFFDELSGIETVQVIQYASRAVQLARELFDDHIEAKFLGRLEAARSNIPEQKDGRHVYERHVRPAMTDLRRVAAHYALGSIFEDCGKSAKLYCYKIDAQDYQRADCGEARLAIGRAKIASEITRESEVVTFGVMHFGHHNVSAWTRISHEEEDYEKMVSQIVRSCIATDFPSIIRLMDRHFGPAAYSLKSLLRDERDRILGCVLRTALEEAVSGYRMVYRSNLPLMRFLPELGNELPEALKSAAAFVVNSDLMLMLESAYPQESAIETLLLDAKTWNIQLDVAALGRAFQKTLERQATELAERPGDINAVNELMRLTELAKALPFTVELRQTQNIYYQLLKSVFVDIQGRAQAGERPASDWVARFVKLGERLSMHVEAMSGNGQ